MNQAYEIIVVDDASTDSTTTVAERSGARVVASIITRFQEPRNAGAAQAQGDLLVFVDADTDVPGTVVTAAIQALRAGAVGGGARAHGSMVSSQFAGAFWSGCGYGSSAWGTSHPVVSCSAPVKPWRQQVGSIKPSSPPT
jgi:glycosyltransferase involved in cell wall biosynthesis